MMFDEYGYEDEEWAYIAGYPNYLISNFGRVWSYKTNRILKPIFDKDGYEYVNLYRNGITRHMKIHRLVAEAFIAHGVDTYEINHDDGDKSYNYIENLEWSTRSKNQLHAFRTGLNSAPNKRSVRVIETNQVFESLTACAKAINGDIGNIHNCLSGKNKTHHGYTFEYT